MTYQVMARKWRPQEFDQIIAQDHVTRTLQNAVRSARIGHAYLFSGPRGVGKTTTARILAKALNCQQGPTPTPCNTCSLCREITDGSNMDVLEIDGASNTGVDNIRNLRETINYAPTSGRYKIYIIDEVHMLSESAFNALLKTLEEPPHHVVFVFATTKPQKIPPTILSRCQRFDFRRISSRHIMERLAYIAEQEKFQVDDDALALIAKKAEGSLRDGQSLLDQVISFGGQRVTRELVSQALGLVNREVFFDLVDAVQQHDSQKGLALVAMVEQQGWDTEEFMAGFLEHLRYLILAKTAPRSLDKLDLSKIDREKYGQQGATLAEGDLMRIIAVASDAERTLRYSSRPRFLLEMMVVRLAKMEETVRLEDLLRSLNQVLGLEAQEVLPDEPLGQNTQERSDPVESPPAVEQPQGEVDTIWNQMLDKVRRKKASLGAILEFGQLAELQDRTLTISFPKSFNFHRQQAQKGQNRKVIEGEASNILGKEVSIKFTLDETREPAQPPTSPQKKPSYKEMLKAEPILGNIMETLDGELIE